MARMRERARIFAVKGNKIRAPFVLQLSQDVLCGDHAEGVASSKGEARLVEGIIISTIEGAAKVADAVKAGDGFACGI